jgi:hypothetical protein
MRQPISAAQLGCEGALPDRVVEAGENGVEDTSRRGRWRLQWRRRLTSPRNELVAVGGANGRPQHRLLG